MTVDFLARKQSKKNAKRLASLNKKGENERRNRAKRGRNRNTVGMCNFAPLLPPALAEEDEQNEAEKKMKKRKMERERLARKAMRKKVKMEMEKNVMGEREGKGEETGGGSDDDEESEKSESEEDEDKEQNQNNNVPEYFIDAMKTIGHRRIAPIQKSSWAALCSNSSDCLSVAPPGSGKTLAFLLPAFDVVIKRVAEFMSSKNDKKDGSNNAISRKNVIDGLIVSPTRELAQQIASVGNKLKRAAPVKLVCVVGGTNQQEQEESLLAPTKLGVLVVGTPGRLCATVCFNAGGTKKSDDGSGKSVVVPASENNPQDHNSLQLMYLHPQLRHRKQK